MLERIRKHYANGGIVNVADPLIQADNSYVIPHGLHFAESATLIVQETDGEQLADAPPPEANYRPADIEAIACWNCAHFERTGVNEANWPAGVCHLWEALVQGQNVCDRYTADPTLMDTDPHRAPQDEYAGDAMLAEVFTPDTGIELSETPGKFKKTILRTGEWDKTPSINGVIKKKLRVVREGASSLKKGIVSLADLKRAFDGKAYPFVTVPLSDEAGVGKDHKNLLQLNQGFVRELEIEDDGDVSRLVATMDITEPDTAEKIRNGTIPDVSSGIYGPVENPDGEKFPVALNHACLTPRPFVSDLGSFAVLASTEDHKVEEADVQGFVPTPTEEEREEETVDPTEWDDRLSFSNQSEAINKALVDQLNLTRDYTVTDIAPERAIVRNKIAGLSWIVPFKMAQEGVLLSTVPEWKQIDGDGGDNEGSDQPSESAAAPEGFVFSADPVEQARQKRELRFASIENPEGGVTMPVGTQLPDGLELSDEQRDALKPILEENQRLRSRSRESEIHQEIERVKGLGFAEEPGFLRAYRDILLSDDEEPAMVLLSHDESGHETDRKKVTASELAKNLINALRRTEDDSRILLAQQHVTSGNDDPPPKDDSEEAPLEQRVAESAAAIGQKMPERAGGE